MSKENLNDRFEAEYKKLNAAQKKAVDQIDGPVLVIAGPGTGKTQILAARIANILLKTDALPENILCLTYTDSGTIAMRKRLTEFIGPDAYRVGIFTFHAFCNVIIQENLEQFGLRNLDPVSELEQIQFVHQIIDRFSKDHPLKRFTGEVYYDTKRLISLYDVMKKEDWSPEHIINKADSYINGLPNRDEFIYKKDSKYGKKGEPKQKELDAEIKRMTMLKAAVQTFESYCRILSENNRYDFSDMILWLIDIFKKQPEILLHYQEQFQYVLVDEFQDTSGSQNDLLQFLISYWDKPNVFAVGDDDQSIYRFQGANIENITDFSDKYAHSLQLVMLTDNYRSSQKILNASKDLIEKNKERLTSNKTLTASNLLYKAVEFLPEIRAYYNSYHEAVHIAKEIESLHKNGIPLNEICVIYRNHAQSEQIIRYLQSKNIPVNTRRRTDVLDESLIEKITTILKYLEAETSRPHSGEHYLFTMLHYDIFDIPPMEIAELSVNISRKNFNERASSWREELKLYKSKKQPSLFGGTEVHDNINKFSNAIEQLIKDTLNLPIQELLEQILIRCGLLVSALTSNEKTWNLQLLSAFFDFVKDECSKNTKTSLRSLIELITLMEENNISLPIQKISYAENGVNFVTAHSSKGLEFEYVYLLGCLRDKWDSARAGNNFKLPDNLFEIAGDETEEARRLFYVAMTRAKKQLCISYPEKDNNNKELEKSRFVAELEDAGNVITKHIHLPDDDLVDFKLNILQSSTSEIPNELIDSHFVSTLLENYSLSVTHLNNYLKCPVSFYFNNLIKIPAPKSASMTFGSAIHFALEKLFKNMNSKPDKDFGTKEEMLKDFKWYMRRNEDCFTEKEFKRRMEYAEHFLPVYYDHYINDWNKVTSIERSYRNVVVDGVPINGKLDKLEFDGNYVNVVDYKTGQFKNAEKKFDRPDKEKVQKALGENKEPKFESVSGGDYWRQAVFYKILMDSDKTKTWTMRSCEFDFVEPDKDTQQFNKYRVEISPEDISIVKQQIRESYSAIMNKEFKKGCGKPDCDWCNFVNNYYSGKKITEVKLSSPEDEN